MNPNYGSFTVLRDNARKDMRVIIEEVSQDKSAKEGSNTQKVRDLYASFLNTKKLEQLGLSALAGGIAKIENINSDADLANYFAEARRVGIRVPFLLYINNDAKKPTRYIVYLTQSGLGLPDRDYYFRDDEKSVKLREAYVAHIEKNVFLGGLERASFFGSIYFGIGNLYCQRALDAS